MMETERNDDPSIERSK